MSLFRPKNFPCSHFGFNNRTVYQHRFFDEKSPQKSEKAVLNRVLSLKRPKSHTFEASFKQFQQSFQHFNAISTRFSTVR